MLRKRVVDVRPILQSNGFSITQCPMSHCSFRDIIFDLQKHSCVSGYPGERHFGTLETIQKGVMDMLKTIPV